MVHIAHHPHTHIHTPLSPLLSFLKRDEKRQICHIKQNQTENLNLLESKLETHQEKHNYEDEIKLRRN